MNRRLFLAIFPAALVTGCGFQLRRLEGIPFASLYVDAPSGSVVAQQIIAAIKTTGSTKVATNAAEADAVLKLENERRTKTILSLSGAGLVTEYRLGLKMSYTISGKNQSTLAEPEVIELNRDMTYDDSILLAKLAEEDLLYRDMQQSVAKRILRRLQAIKPGDGR
jgi:LPS-assembly lipoprotein